MMRGAARGGAAGGERARERKRQVAPSLVIPPDPPPNRILNLHPTFYLAKDAAAEIRLHRPRSYACGKARLTSI
eukprot:4000469-Pyramimonas_sp.AAC.1